MGKIKSQLSLELFKEVTNEKPIKINPYKSMCGFNTDALYSRETKDNTEYLYLSKSQISWYKNMRKIGISKENLSNPFIKELLRLAIKDKKITKNQKFELDYVIRHGKTPYSDKQYYSNH